MRGPRVQGVERRGRVTAATLVGNGCNILSPLQLTTHGKQPFTYIPEARAHNCKGAPNSPTGAL